MKNSYQNFLTNLESIKQRNIPYRFSITISNLTIFGYHEFEEIFGQDNNSIQFCNDPDYLATGVLDLESIERLKAINYKFDDSLFKTALDSGYNSKQKINFVTYLKEFVSRRNLSLEVFPTSFVNWINQS